MRVELQTEMEGGGEMGTEIGREGQKMGDEAGDTGKGKGRGSGGDMEQKGHDRVHTLFGTSNSMTFHDQNKVKFRDLSGGIFFETNTYEAKMQISKKEQH